MRFTIAATAALVAGASASYKRASANETTYVTEIVSSYVTYCPSATEVSHNGVTYTVTEATTLTIENCPCTITKPAPTTAAPVTTTEAPSAPSAYPTTTSAASTEAPVYSSSSLSSYSAPETTSSSSAPSAYPTTSTTSAASTEAPVYSSSAPAVYPTTVAPSYPAGNATAPVGTGVVTAQPSAYTGAAGKVQAAGLAAIFGLAALAL